ncbi:hypothetical protein GCM10025794_33570 [Massilia kyonggiensis]
MQQSSESRSPNICDYWTVNGVGTKEFRNSARTYFYALSLTEEAQQKYETRGQSTTASLSSQPSR